MLNPRTRNHCSRLAKYGFGNPGLNSFKKQRPEPIGENKLAMKKEAY